MGEILYLDSDTADQFRLNSIHESFERGDRFDLSDPSRPSWLNNGLRWLGEKRKLTKEDIKRLDSMGGTDHPDPTLGR